MFIPVKKNGLPSTVSRGPSARTEPADTGGAAADAGTRPDNLSQPAVTSTASTTAGTTIPRIRSALLGSRCRGRQGEQGEQQIGGAPHGDVRIERHEHEHDQ